MFGWSHIMAQQARYKDLLREAERYRLICQVLAGRGKCDRFWYRALTWLGQRLVAWGCRLQERYGVAATVVHPSACQPTLANR
jgi:hypothetical protein